jgi:hypothetical protein
MRQVSGTPPMLLLAALRGEAPGLDVWAVTQPGTSPPNAPNPAKTVLAQLADASLGHNVAFNMAQFAAMLLALAANTSFAGLPVLASLLARHRAGCWTGRSASTPMR